MISNFKIPSKLFAVDDLQFTTKFVQAICEELRAEPLTKKHCRPRDSGKVRLNITIVSMFHQYITKHQRDWDGYVVPLTYAYNTQMYLATKVSQFSVILCRPPPGPATLVGSTMSPEVDHIDSAMVLRILSIHWTAELKRMVDKNLQQAQYRYY